MSTGAVFHQNDGYGRAGLAGVERAMKKRNLELVGKATVERNSVDVANAVNVLSKVNASAIIQISACKMGVADFGGFRVRYSPGNHNGSTFVDLTILSKGGKFRR